MARNECEDRARSLVPTVFGPRPHRLAAARPVDGGAKGFQATLQPRPPRAGARVQQDDAVPIHPGPGCRRFWVGVARLEARLVDEPLERFGRLAAGGFL